MNIPVQSMGSTCDAALKNALDADKLLSMLVQMNADTKGDTFMCTCH